MTLRRLLFIKCLFFLSMLVECGKLTHSLESEEREPKIFQIIEKDDDVFLSKVAPAKNYDRNAMLDFLKNHADFELRVKNILKKDRRLQGRKKKLVKKIVGHNEETDDLQYNAEKDTYFRPIVRLHKIKKFDEFETGDRVDVKFKSRVPQNSRIKAGRIKPGRIESDSNVPKTSAAEHAVLHLSLIDKQIENVPTLASKINFYTQLNKIINDIESLHKAVIEERSVEDLRLGQAPPLHFHDESRERHPHPVVTVAPGVYLNATGPSQQFPCAIYPNDPLWSYWTYTYSIHEDECPGQQVKIDNVCSWIPPHKK